MRNMNQDPNNPTNNPVNLPNNINPEEMANQRLRRVKESSPQQPIQQPTQSSDGPSYKTTVDLNETVNQAKEMDLKNPMKRVEAQALLDLNKHEHHRKVDMESSEEYSEYSKQAIEIINKFFINKQCAEMHFNGPDQIFAKVNGKRVQVDAKFENENDYNHFIEDLIKEADTTETIEQIKSRGRGVVKMAGGDRMAIMMPPFTEYAQASIHKVVARTWQMKDLVENQTMTDNMARFLISAVKAKANILVCGSLGSGKSTALSLLTQYIDDSERFCLIEEVPEIFVAKPDATRITYFPETTSSFPQGLPEVLDTVLYMRMDRIIIGEIHDKGMYRMLRTMSTGADGSLSTFHAESVSSALAQVRNHVLLEHPSLPSKVVSDIVRNAINLVVFLQNIDGEHKVAEIAEVNWRTTSSDNADSTAHQTLFKYDFEQKRFITNSFPDKKGKIVSKARKYGIIIKEEWFKDIELGN